jgi:hypothetical protein
VHARARGVEYHLLASGLQKALTGAHKLIREGGATGGRGVFLEGKLRLVVRASDCQCTSCNGPGFDPSIRRHSGI